MILNVIWFNAPNGVISLPPSSEPIIAGHCVSIVGADVEKKLLIFANSWGSDWGENGLGTMPFEYFDRYMTEAWALSGYREKPPIENYTPGIQYLNWGQKTFAGAAFHAMEVYDYSRDERIGWAFAIERDDWLDVEELFVKPAFRRQGYGSRLLVMIAELKGLLQRPVRFWMPHSDWSPANREVAARFFARIGLTTQPSGVRWASSLVAEGDSVPPIDAGIAVPPASPKVFNPSTGKLN